MLISTDLSWVKPAWPGHHYLAVLPQHEATEADIARLRDRAIVFEFTERPRTALPIIREIVLRVAAYRQFETSAFLFSADKCDDATCAALRAKVDENPYLVSYEPGEAPGEIRQIVIGAKITGNPLFAKFFKNLKNVDTLDPAHVIEQIEFHLVPGDKKEAKA